VAEEEMEDVTGVGLAEDKVTRDGVVG